MTARSPGMPQAEPPRTGLRDAATVIVLRQDGRGDPGPRVLMGQRSAGAAFMPSKFVFPGGAVDPEDHDLPLAAPLPEITAERLACDAPPGCATALAAAAIRELWEETGLALGRAAPWADPPAQWQGFADQGLRPDADGLHFIFRAVTPRGQARRFDARFFLVDAARLDGDLDDFSRASDELSGLHWVSLASARHLNLPFITTVVLAELDRLLMLGTLHDRDGTPFYDNRAPQPRFGRLGIC